ncbi:MAG: P1 family peptidase [Mogibacterium sp.]|nr:P1 family peptidase [Mogibacterium sp.]MBR4092029.1 P1 family peptidase [Mogibacterium sp.]
MKMISVTDIEDFKLGNAENREKGTGCTVIICEEGAVGGVDVRGGGPATRETDLLRSENTVNSVNAVVLSGGSAFGLEAASGVMRELAERRIGFNAGDDIVVPIVCGASLYDLPVGDPKAFPDVYMGAQAVRNAYDNSFARGNHGAGTGATVGKMKGYDRAMKTGLGAFACGDGVIEVGAIAAVNAVGDIYSGAGKIIAGLRSEDGKSIYGTIKTLKGMVHDKIRLTDDNTSFINRSEVEEALAAAAKQYEEEAAARKTEETEADTEPEEEIAEAAEAETETEEETVTAPAEVTEEEAAEAAAEEEFNEEPAEEAAEEEPACEADEQASENNFEEPADEIIEEPAPEFIPETPAVSAADVNSLEYAEISIPEVSAEAVSDEEAAGEPAEEPAEEIAEETEEETAEEAAEEEPAEEAGEQAAENNYEEPADEIVEEPAPEETSVTAAEEEAFKEPDEEMTGEPDIETPEEPAEEAAEEPAAQETSEEIPEETAEETAEEFTEEPAGEIAEEAAEEFAEEAPEETEETEEEEPVVLTREEMGYDIVFNTTISCLITNADLTKSQANKLASILHDAYARAIKPVHGTLDGDTVFVLATGKQQVNFDAFAALATDVMQYAIIDGAMSAESAYGIPAARDM